MFTGLIEKVGTINAFRRAGDSTSLVIGHDPWDVPLKKGDSVAVQGACLTVTDALSKEFTCDVLTETVERTCIHSKKEGSLLNLERALKADSRLGGHFVSGHIDGTGTVENISTMSSDRVLSIKCDESLVSGIIEKGSIAIDGASLTVTAVSNSTFAVRIIPFTWENTSLSILQERDPVNLETDMLGKYVRRSLGGQSATESLTMDDLRNAGFA